MSTPAFHQCHACKLKLSNPEDLSTHYYCVHNYFLCCRFCPEQFGLNLKLSNHIRQVHTDKRKFICFCCNKRCKSSGEYTQHVQSAHKNYRLCCRKCGIVRKSSKARDIHEQYCGNARGPPRHDNTGKVQQDTKERERMSECGSDHLNNEARRSSLYQDFSQTDAEEDIKANVRKEDDITEVDLTASDCGIKQENISFSESTDHVFEQQTPTTEINSDVSSKSHRKKSKRLDDIKNEVNELFNVSRPKCDAVGVATAETEKQKLLLMCIHCLIRMPEAKLMAHADNDVDWAVATVFCFECCVHVPTFAEFKEHLQCYRMEAERFRDPSLFGAVKCKSCEYFCSRDDSCSSSVSNHHNWFHQEQSCFCGQQRNGFCRLRLHELITHLQSNGQLQSNAEDCHLSVSSNNPKEMLQASTPKHADKARSTHANVVNNTAHFEVPQTPELKPTTAVELYSSEHISGDVLNEISRRVRRHTFNDVVNINEKQQRKQMDIPQARMSCALTTQTIDAPMPLLTSDDNFVSETVEECPTDRRPPLVLVDKRASSLLEESSTNETVTVAQQLLATLTTEENGLNSNAEQCPVIKLSSLVTEENRTSLLNSSVCRLNQGVSVADQTTATLVRVTASSAGTVTVSHCSGSEIVCETGYLMESQESPAEPNLPNVEPRKRSSKQSTVSVPVSVVAAVPDGDFISARVRKKVSNKTVPQQRSAVAIHEPTAVCQEERSRKRPHMESELNALSSSEEEDTDETQWEGWEDDLLKNKVVRQGLTQPVVQRNRIRARPAATLSAKVLTKYPKVKACVTTEKLASAQPRITSKQLADSTAMTVPSASGPHTSNPSRSSVPSNIAQTVVNSNECTVSARGNRFSTQQRYSGCNDNGFGSSASRVASTVKSGKQIIVYIYKCKYCDMTSQYRSSVTYHLINLHGARGISASNIEDHYTAKRITADFEDEETEDVVDDSNRINRHAHMLPSVETRAPPCKECEFYNKKIKKAKALLDALRTGISELDIFSSRCRKSN